MVTELFKRYIHCSVNIACYQIVDIDDGHICGPHEPGELCVRTDMIMKGYLNRPKETADMLDEDGFLHSGRQGCFK